MSGALIVLVALIYATGILAGLASRPAPPAKRSYTIGEIIQGALALGIWVLVILCLLHVPIHLPACFS